MKSHRRVLVLAGATDRAAALRRDVRDGLAATPKRVRSRWLWDERGSALFDEITRLPEYYPTRCERALLARHASEIAQLAEAEELLELGSGSAEKTTLLIDALSAAGLRRAVLLDVDEVALRGSLAALGARYPELELRGVAADFEQQLLEVPPADRRLLALLGSTIGAFEPDERAALLLAAASAAGSHGALLLGLDLVKSPGRIEAAYNDAAGLSAELIANLLPVLNRELGADFDPSRFRSEARWVPELERMEMAVRALEDQTVSIPALGLRVALAAGETIRTEISTKFRRNSVEAELAAAGLRLAGWWTDAVEDYALCLARRASV
jgi:L-histidine N-alpha-methyltransferase